MEVQVDIDGSIVEWLASMGYPVAGMPGELLQGMLLREARQWQLSPGALEGMIKEDARERRKTPTFEPSRPQWNGKRVRVLNGRFEDSLH